MNFMKLRIKALLLLAVIITGACSENWALKEETFAISDENGDWVPLEVPDSSFLMKDIHGITQGFVMVRDEQYMNKSWGGFLGLNTHMTFSEYRFRSYSSTYGHNFHISLRAATWEPYGDELSVQLMDLDFSYDLGLGRVTSIYTPYKWVSYTQTSEGYESEDTIFSTCEIIDSLVFDNLTYRNVLHFTLADNPDQWSESIPTNIYIARGTGLISYTLNNGISYQITE